MRPEVSRFQERTALLLGAGTLLGLVFGKRRPSWGGILLFGMGGLLIRSGIGWLRSAKPIAVRQPVENRRRQSEPSFDIVTENSEESFPASDPPSFAMGVR